MPDEIDRASENAAFLLEARIKEQRRKALPPLRPPLIRGEREGSRGGAITCEDCGEVIPEKRRKAVPGCLRCIGCQREFESK